MATERPPSFQFYPKDFLTSQKQSVMSAAGAGIYIRLLCHCWLGNGLPSDPIALSRLAAVSMEEFEREWTSIKYCFVVDADGQLQNKRLKTERKKQTHFNKSQSNNGIRGAKARWGRHAFAIKSPSPQHGEAIIPPMPENSSSSSSSSSTPVSLSRGSLTLQNPPTDEIATRAGSLVRRYQELYGIKRAGARYRPRPNLDWLEACELCKIWDDARLERLAAIVLTTDDDWISTTDRSFKIFAMKASWADDRLMAYAKEHGVAV